MQNASIERRRKKAKGEKASLLCTPHPSRLMYKQSLVLDSYKKRGLVYPYKTQTASPSGTPSSLRKPPVPSPPPAGNVSLDLVDEVLTA